MSFSDDLDDEQQGSQADENQQGGTGIGTASTKSSAQSDSGVSLGGGGPGVASPTAAPTVAPTGGDVGGTGQTAKTEDEKPSSSGSWTNLQSYLDANADQSSQVGSKIAGTVGGQAQTAQNDVNSAAGDFTKNVNSNTVAADPDAVNKAITDATGAKAGSAYSPDEAANFQKQANASYNGPTDFTQSSGYGQAQRDLNTAQTSLHQLGSEAGRDVLLGNQYGQASQNGYNQGEQNLDQMLLENNPQNQKTFSGLQGQWSGIGNALGQATTAANTQAQNAVATDQATAKAAQDALAQANGTFQGTLNTQTTKAQADAQAAYQAMLASMKTNTYTPEQLAALGVAQGSNDYGVDPTHFLSSGVTPTLYNSATSDQYAQAAALASLGGTGAASLLPAGDASQAGTASPYTFDKTGFGQAIAGKGAGLQGDIKNFMEQQYFPAVGSPGTPNNASEINAGNFMTAFPELYARAVSLSKLTGNTQELASLNALMPAWTALQQELTGKIDENPLPLKTGPGPQKRPT